jgi:hypothetical protein
MLSIRYPAVRCYVYSLRQEGVRSVNENKRINYVSKSMYLHLRLACQRVRVLHTYKSVPVIKFTQSRSERASIILQRRVDTKNPPSSHFQTASNSPLNSLEIHLCARAVHGETICSPAHAHIDAFDCDGVGDTQQLAENENADAFSFELTVDSFNAAPSHIDAFADVSSDRDAFSARLCARTASACALCAAAFSRFAAINAFRCASHVSNFVVTRCLHADRASTSLF